MCISFGPVDRSTCVSFRRGGMGRLGPRGGHLALPLGDRRHQANRRAFDRLLHRCLIMTACLLVSACSSIIEGTSQEIAINTNPSGADCGLYRQGTRIAEVSNTPGSALVKKTKYDITLVCVKDGYQQATFLNHSGAAGATFGNIVLGGGIGWAIDSASGADNKYDGVVNLTLVPAQSATVAPPPSQAVAKLPDNWGQPGS